MEKPWKMVSENRHKQCVNDCIASVISLHFKRSKQTSLADELPFHLSLNKLNEINGINLMPVEAIDVGK